MLKIKLENEEFSGENLSERAQGMLERLKKLELEMVEKKKPPSSTNKGEARLHFGLENRDA